MSILAHGTVGWRSLVRTEIDYSYLLASWRSSPSSEADRFSAGQEIPRLL
jgi:hypothetical protein